MRVLLHNFETRLYYAGPDQWTKDSWLAFDFGTVQAAVDIYKQGRLDFAEILLDEGPRTGSDPLPLLEDVSELSA